MQSRHRQQSRCFAAEDDLAVGLVGDDEQTMFLGNVGDQFKFLTRPDLAGRIVGTDDDDGPGLGCNPTDDLFLCRHGETAAQPQWNRNQVDAIHAGTGLKTAVQRFKH